MKQRYLPILGSMSSRLKPLIIALAGCSFTGANASVLINEVDADQTSTDNAEFIELYDGGAGNTDLTGLSIVLYNGSDNASYNAFDLDGLSTNAEGYFVLCGDAANTANCDLDVNPNTNLIQNGADAVALVQGDASDFPNDTPVSTENLIDAIVYDTFDGDDPQLLVLLNPGQPQVNEGGNGSKDTDSNQRCDIDARIGRNTDGYQQFPPTPGMSNTCEIEVVEIGQCSDEATYIHDIQGNGASSPLFGENNIIIEGIVTADFQASNELSGFFIQEEDEDTDADVTTSEGLFVYHSSDNVNVGDQVRVIGRVNEFSGNTQLDQVSDLIICDTGGAISQSSLTLPLNSIEEFEQVEGMLVDFAQPLTVNDNFNLARYGELELSAGRLYQFTHNNLPNVDGYSAHQTAVALNKITLDDGSTKQNPEIIPYPELGLTSENTLRIGYTTSVTGVLSYAFGKYRIHPTESVLFAKDNDRNPEPPLVGGDLKLASFNVLNYFNTIDNAGTGCGPDGVLGCRGADSEAEFTRQRDKTLQAISKIDADIVGINEIENNSVASIKDLVDGLNALMGENTYSYVDTGTIGTDAIKVALIYKASKVSLLNDFAILDSSVNPLFIDDKNRPSLAQTFTSNNGETFTVVVNHFKSKGSSCANIGDPNKNDGQGNCSATRKNASIALSDWLKTDPTQSSDDDFIILGDLNSYAKEDTVTYLTDNGFINLIDMFNGAQAYSFIFSGESGYLDHAIASESMVDKVTGVAEWHINADEPRVLDYNVEFKSDEQVNSLYSVDSFRSSDHDPVIIGLQLNNAPECQLAQPSTSQLWSPNHKFVPISILGVTDADNDKISISIDSIFQDEEVNGTGSGDTSVDGRGINTETAEIRAERDGNGDGRFYHISFTATDTNGASCSNTVQVIVPKSKGKKSNPVDGGALFDSTTK
ncbi:ExeM/NucH family extracellular endonuclease [Thalassotalea atypica]|uniref:ExeM/NucH family extracellular endonuclease n=1 Tax=Thalassotalea atypica TaxID=2054316 RepID=UPI002572E268|nr:ExeM/NucH family extracellular endonuclease [Thalassotalea atypica]